MKKRYQKPAIRTKKVETQFLRQSNRSVDFVDGINRFSSIDESQLLAFCCGTCCVASLCECTSDRRVKKNIKPIGAGVIENLEKLYGVSFKWRNKILKHPPAKKHTIGLIAQDVEKVYPELVTSRQGIKRIDYTGIIALLVEAVKELKEENRQLKKVLQPSR